MGLNLHATVGMDGSGFEAGLNKLHHAAEHGFESIKGMAMAAFGVYGIEQAIHKTIEYGENIFNLSRQLGIGSDALQEFGFAAEQNGASLEKFAKFSEILGKNRGSAGMQKDWLKLGITPEDQKKPIEDIIMKMSLKAKNTPAQELAGPLRKIGGRGGDDMIPMLKDNLEELRKKAIDLGQVMDQEMITSMKLAGDEMKVLGRTLIIGLAPAIAFAIQHLQMLGNTLRATFGKDGFWDKFTKTTKPSDFFTAVRGSLSTNGSEEAKRGDEAARRISKSFVAAGAASDEIEARLFELDEARMAALLRVLNSDHKKPNFQDPEPKKEKEEKFRAFTDQLTGTGNFLGSAKDVMQTIGHEHTRLLKKIEANTRKGNESGLNEGGNDENFPG